MTNLKKVLWAVGGAVVVLLLLAVVGIFLNRREVLSDISSRDYASTALYSKSSAGIGGGFEAPMALESSRSVGGKSDAGGGGEVAPDRMVIKTGSLSLVVENVRESAATIKTLVEQWKGFIVSSNVQEGDDANVFGTVIARVPAKSFDELLAASKGIAKKVQNEYVSGEDVTEEYRDVEAELRNRRAEEQQFLEILKNAKTIEETLAVTRELSRVRWDIDRVEGRRKYLEQSVALATLTISLATDEAALPVIEQDEWRPIVSAKNALRGLVSVLKGLSYFIIWFVVFAVLWIPLALLWKYGRRWWKRRKGELV